MYNFKLPPYRFALHLCMLILIPDENIDFNHNYKLSRWHNLTDDVRRACESSIISHAYYIWPIFDADRETQLPRWKCARVEVLRICTPTVVHCVFLLGPDALFNDIRDQTRSGIAPRGDAGVSRAG